MELRKGLESILFISMYKEKLEILTQLCEFDIFITAKGFFNIDRRFIGTVGLTHIKRSISEILTELSFLFQMTAMSCTYVVIFIQFDMAMVQEMNHT